MSKDTPRPAPAPHPLHRPPPVSLSLKPADRGKRVGLYSGARRRAGGGGGQRHHRDGGVDHAAARAGVPVRAEAGGADHGDRRGHGEYRQDDIVVARGRLAGDGGLCRDRHSGGSARGAHAAGAAVEPGRCGARPLLPGDGAGAAGSRGAQPHARALAARARRRRDRLPHRHRRLDRAAERAGLRRHTASPRGRSSRPRRRARSRSSSARS